MTTILFSKISRTICLAYVVFASRYYQNNITDDALQYIFNSSRTEKADSHVYEYMRNLSDINCIIPQHVFADKDCCDEVLYQLFMQIINAGSMCYSMAVRYEEGLNASNYLKKDKNYYSILQFQWQSLKASIKDTFDLLK